MLRLIDIAFVGSGVLGSAIGMDKETAKRLLNESNIPVAKFLTLRHSKEVTFKKAKAILGIPMFIKPANMGSSIGVSKVENKDEFIKAVNIAFQYDRKVIIEEAIVGREIECAVLGNENPIASIPGEVIVQSDFYSYEAKYIDENGALLDIPAKLPKATIKKVQNMALRTFKVLGLEGMARVDFFLQANGVLIVNEVNTIPGFTKISMYPKLWELSGISYAELIDKLLQLGMERYCKEKKLKTTYQAI